MENRRRATRKPDALFALSHFAWLVVFQCGRLWDSVERQEAMNHLPEWSPEFMEARHEVLGDRFFLLCAGREMVRAIDALNFGRLPGRMHDELRDVRDALTHWDEWGAERSKAQRRLLSNHPDDWPFQLEISGGEILLGASLKLSEVGEAALRLYEWTRDPSSPTGLYVKPDPHTHQLVARFRKQSFFRVAHALKRKGFKCAGANDYLVILLRRPDAAGAAMDVVLAADGGATFGPVERIPDDDGDEAEDNEIDDDAGRND